MLLRDCHCLKRLVLAEEGELDAVGVEVFIVVTTGFDRRESVQDEAFKGSGFESLVVLFQVGPRTLRTCTDGICCVFKEVSAWAGFKEMRSILLSGVRRMHRRQDHTSQPITRSPTPNGLDPETRVLIWLLLATFEISLSMGCGDS